METLSARETVAISDRASAGLYAASELGTAFGQGRIFSIALLAGAHLRFGAP